MSPFFAIIGKSDLSPFKFKFVGRTNFLLQDVSGQFWFELSEKMFRFTNLLKILQISTDIASQIICVLLVLLGEILGIPKDTSRPMTKVCPLVSSSSCQLIAC